MITALSILLLGSSISVEVDSTKCSLPKPTSTDSSEYVRLMKDLKQR